MANSRDIELSIRARDFASKPINEIRVNTMLTSSALLTQAAASLFSKESGEQFSKESGEQFSKESGEQFSKMIARLTRG